MLRFHDLRFYEPSTILLKISILTTLLSYTQRLHTDKHTTEENTLQPRDGETHTKKNKQNYNTKRKLFTGGRKL